MAILSINYDDGNIKDLGYESVSLSSRSFGEHIFNSGDFPKDWLQANSKYNENSNGDHILCLSSSVDNFIMDEAPYDSVWLIIDEDTEKPILVYEYHEDGWKFFVEKGQRPTWEELKEKYSV